MADSAFCRCQHASQNRQNLRRNVFPVVEALRYGAPKGRLAHLVRGDKLAQFVNGADTVQITFTLRRAPGEQAVAAEDDSVALGIFRDDVPEHQAKFESGPLPGKPNEITSEAFVELRHFLLTVGAGRERYRPIGMKVIHVRKRQKSVQRCVDRSGNFVCTERGGRIIANHFVFVRLALIQRDKLFEFVEIEKRETCLGDRSQIASAALDGEHADGLASEGIGKIQLGTSISTSKIGDT